MSTHSEFRKGFHAAGRFLTVPLYLCAVTLIPQAALAGFAPEPAALISERSFEFTATDNDAKKGPQDLSITESKVPLQV